MALTGYAAIAEPPKAASGQHPEGPSCEAGVIADATVDTLLGGRVVLRQPARGTGYRANVDALLLAHFAARGGRSAGVAFDLGAGAGAVGLALMHYGGAGRVVFVELDRHAAALATANTADNGWADRTEVVCADVRDVARERAGEAHLVVCNPPYFAFGRGRRPKSEAVARARSGDLAEFVEAARDLTGRRARACFVYPAHELNTLLATLRRTGLEPKRMRAVHATRGAPARIVLVESQPAKPGGLSVLPPLVEREGAGYTDELRAILGD